MPLGFSKISLKSGLNHVVDEDNKTIDPNAMIFLREGDGSMTEIGTLNEIIDLSAGTGQLKIQGRNLGTITEFPNQKNKLEQKKENFDNKLYISKPKGGKRKTRKQHKKNKKTKNKRKHRKTSKNTKNKK